MIYIFFKRFFDLVLSIFLIIILLFPFMILSVIIKIDSKGPIIYSSIRIGYKKRKFIIYKFRSLKVTAPDNVSSNNIDSEKQITNVGKFIRRFSIDELPQIINIIKGDMSFIGPRPSIESEKDLIELREKYNVYSVKPGLSGLAQIEGRDVLAADYKKKALKDQEYVEKFGFFLDLRIFFKTINVVLFGKGYKN